MKLDKRSNIPLYAQLKDWILERIASGQFPAGQQIPSELILCEELALSRPTVRQAIAELVAEGTLVIQKGKGTFVSAEPERLEIRQFSPFSYSLLAAKSLSDYLFQSIEQLPPDEETLRLFEGAHASGNPGFWSLTWPILIHGREIGLGHSLIPVNLFPDFGDQVQSGKSMIDILANKYAYLPSKGSCQLAVRAATHEEALALDISRRSPVLCATSRLTSRSGHVCEWLELIWRPDSVKLSLEAGRT